MPSKLTPSGWSGGFNDVRVEDAGILECFFYLSRAQRNWLKGWRAVHFYYKGEHLRHALKGMIYELADEREYDEDNANDNPFGA